LPANVDKIDVDGDGCKNCRRNPMGLWAGSIALVLAAAQPAAAGRAEADACAASLSATGQQMYSAIVAQLSPNTNPQTVARDTIRGLVQSGSLSRRDAQNNADAVSGCLALLQSN
jgi:hypothetical protein